MNRHSEEQKTKMAEREDLSANEVEIRLSADPTCLCIVRSAVQKAAETVGFGQPEVDAITLALEEALANTIRHGYGGPCEQPIMVKLKRILPGENTGAGLEIIVRDFGQQVDPREIKSRDLDDIRPGGLGVHIIQSTMDQVEYSCPADRGMQLRMFKRIGSSASKDPNSALDKTCS